VGEGEVADGAWRLSVVRQQVIKEKPRKVALMVMASSYATANGRRVKAHGLAREAEGARRVFVRCHQMAVLDASTRQLRWAVFALAVDQMVL